MPAAGFAIDLLPGRGLLRSVRPRAIAQNLRTVWDTDRSPWCSRVRLVRRLRPRVVVGVGGYASLPALVAARPVGIPTVVHEADAHPGLANRIAVRLGARPAVSLPGTALPGAVVTGNPIRPAIAAVRRAPVTPPLVAVVGGSLGARSLNRAALDLYDRWRDRTDVTIHHVAGARDYEECRTRLAALRRPGDALAYRLVPFEEHMEVIYTEATVVVSRAGRHDRRAHRGRDAGGAGAPPRRARRPPDRERRRRWPRPAPRWSSPTPSSTPPASTASSGALLADPARCAAMSAAAARARAPRRHRALRRSGGGGGRCPLTSTSLAPARHPHRRRRRRGHERDRDRAAAHGPPRQRFRPPRARACWSASASSTSPPTSATRRTTCPTCSTRW